NILPRTMAPIARRCCPSRAPPPHTSGRSKAASRVSRILRDNWGSRRYKISGIFHRTCYLSASAFFPPAWENLMLSVPLSFEGPSLSSKLTRRQLLHMGGLSMLGLGLPGVLRANEPGIPARAREPGTPTSASDKSCIFIVMGGGPSHVDIWDMKPQAPAEIRGPYKPIATAVPGVHINELMPRLAKMGQHYSIIRSMTHTAPIRNHPDAMHNCLTGTAKAPDDAPCFGSVLAKLRPSRRVLTPYVWLHRCDGNTTVFCSPFISLGGFLGRPYAPF